MAVDAVSIELLSAIDSLQQEKIQEIFAILV